MKFRSDEDGFITALRFYKQPNNIGTHVGHLWTSTGPAARRGPVHGRDGVGVAGGGAADAGPDHRRTPPTSPPTTRATGSSRSAAATSSAGVDTAAAARARRTPSPAATASTSYGPSALPRLAPSTRPTTGSTPSSSSMPPADTRRAAGQRRLAGGRRHRACRRAPRSPPRFDEPLDPLTVNAGSFTLADGDGNAVVAQVTYDAATPEGHAHAAGAARARQDLHRHGQERHRRSDRPVRATGSPPTGPGRSAPRSQCPCTVFARRRRPAGRRRQRPAGRGGDEVPLRRGRLHHGAALLQAGEQHGHARGPPLVRHRRAAGGGHVHRRDRLGLAAGRTSPTRCRSRRTPPTSPPTTRAAGRYGFSPGFFNQGVDRPPLHAPNATARRRQRRLPLRRQRLPRPDLQRDQLLGRRDLRPHDPAGHARADGHRAGARGRRLRRAGHDSRSRRPSTSSSPRRSVTGATFTLRDEDGNLVPGRRELRRADARREAQAAVGARQLRDLPRRASRAAPAASPMPWATRSPPTRPGRSPPSRSRPAWARAARSRSSPIPADPFGRYYAEILRGRGPQRVRRDRRAGHRAEARRPQRGDPGLGRGHATPRSRCSPAGCRAAAT